MFRFGFSSTDPSDRTEQDPVDLALHFVPGVPQLGDISISGLSNVGQGRPNATFGRITETSTTARQIQLGIKVLF